MESVALFEVFSNSFRITNDSADLIWQLLQCSEYIFLLHISIFAHFCTFEKPKKFSKDICTSHNNLFTITRDNVSRNQIHDREKPAHYMLHHTTICNCQWGSFLPILSHQYARNIQKCPTYENKSETFSRFVKKNLDLHLQESSPVFPRTVSRPQPGKIWGVSSFFLGNWRKCFFKILEWSQIEL